MGLYTELAYVLILASPKKVQSAAWKGPSHLMFAGLHRSDCKLSDIMLKNCAETSHPERTGTREIGRALRMTSKFEPEHGKRGSQPQEHRSDIVWLTYNATHPSPCMFSNDVQPQRRRSTQRKDVQCRVESIESGATFHATFQSECSLCCGGTPTHSPHINTCEATHADTQSLNLPRSGKNFGKHTILIFGIRAGTFQVFVLTR